MHLGVLSHFQKSLHKNEHANAIVNSSMIVKILPPPLSLSLQISSKLVEMFSFEQSISKALHRSVYLAIIQFCNFGRRYLLCCSRKRLRRRHRRSSDLSSRGRGQSFSLVSSRKYPGDSRREQRSVMRLSILAGDMRPTTPSKEQETTITLSAYPNGVNETLRSQRCISMEPTAGDRLVIVEKTPDSITAHKIIPTSLTLILTK